MSRTSRGLISFMLMVLFVGLLGCSSDEPSGTRTSSTPTPLSTNHGETKHHAQSHPPQLAQARQRLAQAVAKQEGRTRKLFAVINLACRREYYFQGELKDLRDPARQHLLKGGEAFRLYQRVYQRFWYPSQVVAFPYDLYGAMKNACPRQFVEVGPGGLVGG